MGKPADGGGGLGADLFDGVVQVVQGDGAADAEAAAADGDISTGGAALDIQGQGNRVDDEEVFREERGGADLAFDPYPVLAGGGGIRDDEGDSEDAGGRDGQRAAGYFLAIEENMDAIPLIRVENGAGDGYLCAHRPVGRIQDDHRGGHDRRARDEDGEPG